MEVDIDASELSPRPQIFQVQARFYCGVIWYTVTLEGETRELCFYRNQFFRYRPEIDESKWVEVQAHQPLVDRVIGKSFWSPKRQIRISERSPFVQLEPNLPSDLCGGELGVSSFRHANGGCICQSIRNASRDQFGMFCNNFVVPGTLRCYRHKYSFDHFGESEISAVLNVGMRDFLERSSREIQEEIVFWTKVRLEILLVFLRSAELKLLRFDNYYSLIFSDCYRLNLSNDSSAEQHNVLFSLNRSGEQVKLAVSTSQFSLPASRIAGQLVASEEIPIYTKDQTGRIRSCYNLDHKLNINIGDPIHNSIVTSLLPSFTEYCRYFRSRDEDGIHTFIYHEGLFYSTVGLFDAVSLASNYTEIREVELERREQVSLVWRIHEKNEPYEESNLEFSIMKILCETKLLHLRILLMKQGASSHSPDQDEEMLSMFDPISMTDEEELIIDYYKTIIDYVKKIESGDESWISDQIRSELLRFS